jgi:hypothetical protein
MLIISCNQIDWTKVAHNPVLAQPITNGHAARMRYSRFKAAMLGLEPQRRNRTNASNNNNKSRVSKKKKDDGAIPKKEEEEKSSGSGIGNIKTEKATGTRPPTIKSETKGDIHPPQPPAPMTTPVMAMKTEPGLANPYTQHQPLRRPSIFATASPRIKQELVPSNNANTIANTMATTAAPMAEPIPFGLVTTTPSTSASASSTPYLDNQHRMHMRFLTPCSDSDGAASMQGFLPHSPVPSTAELFHPHQHSQPPAYQQHHHQFVGAGSPPLSASTSASASSPFDFNNLRESSPTTWHSQPALHHHSLGHVHAHAHAHAHHSQPAAAMYSPSPAFSIGLGLGLGGDNNNSHHNNNHNNGSGSSGGNNDNNADLHTFCGEHHHLHHHQHQQQHQGHGFEEDAHFEVDPLGLDLGAAAKGEWEGRFEI